MTCNILTDKDPTEDIIVTFDYSDALADTEILVNIASVIVTVNAGVDLTPQNILSQTPWIDPTGKFAQQPVIGGLDNVTYSIQMLCDTNIPNRRLAVTGILPVRKQSNG